MFTEVLLARESIAGAAVAIGVGAHEWFLGIGILLVDFALMTEKAARVSESLNLVAVRLVALVRAIMFIHMFAGSR